MRNGFNCILPLPPAPVSRPCLLPLPSASSLLDFALAGGDVTATVADGPVTVRVGARSWRGRGLDVHLASGDLTVELPAGFSGDLDAQVLRAGRVENAYAGLAPRERTQPTERSLQARAGAGGPQLSFTVGDGTLRIRQKAEGREQKAEGSRQSSRRLH